jgi:hypothetical protein
VEIDNEEMFAERFNRTSNLNGESVSCRLARLWRAVNSKPEKFIDGRFFAELEKEGFIRKLWK